MDPEAKDLPLRDDVSTLGALLGDVLREQEGPELYSRVEIARLAARARRSGDETATAELEARLCGLDATTAEATARAFSAYFRLVNLAERIHRIRRRRDYLEADAAPQPGSVAAVLLELARQGVPREEVEEALGHCLVIPVFTAHPTEATRRSLLANEQRIARALVERLGGEALLPVEERSALARIREDVTVAWQTEEQPPSRLTVADEAESVLFYITSVVYRIVPALYAAVSQALADVYGDPVLFGLERPLLRFGSWVGGDMDGNPNVGAATLSATLRRQRTVVLERYRDELRELYGRLSQSRTRVRTSPELEERIGSYVASRPGWLAAVPERHRDMPYRVMVSIMHSRVEAALRGEDGAYGGSGELLADLRMVADSLRDNRGSSAGLVRVQRLVQRVVTFGFHLATLDVRQDARVLRRAAGALLGRPDYPGLAPEERLRVLEDALVAPTLVPQRTGEELAGVLAVFGAIGAAHREYGPESVGPYIVSMAEGPDDCLAVLVLARAGGLGEPGRDVPLDVAPLFETVPALHGGAATLERLLELPVYREHLRARGEQMVMLGYSDSNKQSGFAASRAALYEAEAALLDIADRAGVRLRLFHGRGGTASRGGSKPRDAILAEPPGAVRGYHRVTEQGEIIHTKYGLRDIALRTLELMFGAVVQATLRTGSGPAVDPEWLRVLRLVASESERAYRELVYDDPGFEDYFRAVTPIDVIERLAIGSRPSGREGEPGIRGLRAIPWTFAWMQNRHVLPAWYGLGTGLAAAKRTFGLSLLRRMARRWPFFANLLADAEMAMAKADLGIGARYVPAAGPAGAAFFERELAEYDRARRLVCEIQEIDELLDREPTLQRTIILRNPYVDPMSLLQVDVLARWRAGGRSDPGLERVLVTTVRGIARGLQNTG